jgi:hypothetical protein
MRKFGRMFGWLARLVAGCALGASLGGCGSSIHDSTAPGPVDSGLYSDAALDNKQRLAGEDVRVVPLYKTPFEAFGVGFDILIGHPIVHFFDYITHDSASYAARKMADTRSPDNQREGMLRLTDFPFARQGIYIKGYAILARNGGDFTLRAAGIRALNRCRAKGYTVLFLESLSDDQPLVRLEAADALANIPDPEAIPLLLIHMGADAEPSSDVRIECAEALRNFHTTEVMRALVNELDDTEFGVAWQARQSLELLTGQDFRYDAKAWLNYLAAGA